ncbi:Golgi transport complex subunit COG3 Ecym_5536 [Eremothecium cymbalariae DBVPG|uniref:Conserved oligomeric Golgi complex subunit 3 n=1 Tax=Eremothecium cymbalariae (strain CBS 270.75 / DBVPG 7215 / KCTC 17166 / NRRL Y-17582) TaxID=931890 RepID=I6NDY4_ERECY|nr:hypothetical protein Ecym_5536 [Eremothecium cymbalariae DBVPG\
MPRSRKNSLVQNIASNFNPASTNGLPTVFEDDSLRQKFANVEYGSLPQANELDSRPSMLFELDQIDSQSSNSNYSLYNQYVDQLDSKSMELEKVLGQTCSINQQLTDIVSRFNNISIESIAFQKTTNALYDKCHEMDLLHKDITEQLSYFVSLDPITRKMNQYSGVNAVKKESFKSTLRKIDNALEFLDLHRSYQDSETYRIKFKQCLIRSCSLVTNYLVNSIKNLDSEVSEGIATLDDINSNATTREALLYNKFAANAEEFQSLVILLVDRINKKSNDRYREELTSLLNVIYEQYFHTRFRLLQPNISSQLNWNFVNAEDRKLVKFIQSSLFYFTQLCEKEYNLFIAFFPEYYSKVKVNDWFFELCEPLYDCVRSHVLRENSINILCDSINLLNKYFQFEEDSHGYELQFNQIRFDRLFEPLMQEIQSRLVFRSQVFVDQYVIRFKPSKDSFIIQKSHNNLNDERSNSLDSDSSSMVAQFLESYNVANNSNTISNPMGGYHPPLIYSLAILSKIYQLVNSSVFDDLAHHIVHDCIESLKNAYLFTSVSANNLDTQLFYLKNLLMLRDEIQNFDIQYIRNETYLDFSGLGGLIKSIRHRSFDSSKSSSALSLARESVPKVVNNMMDARTELIVELRNLLSELTESAAKGIIQSTFQYESSDDVLSKNIKLRSNIQEQLPRIKELVKNFITDDSIFLNILKAIQGFLVRSYTNYYDKINDDITNRKLNEHVTSEIMHPDVFSDFIDHIIDELMNKPASQPTEKR